MIYQKFLMTEALYNLQPTDALSHVVRGQGATLQLCGSCFFMHEYKPTVGGGGVSEVGVI